MRALVRQWLVRRFTPSELRVLGPSVDDIVKRLSPSDLALLRYLWRGDTRRAMRYGAEAMVRQVLDPSQPLPLVWCLGGGLGGGGGDDEDKDEDKAASETRTESGKSCDTRSAIVDKLGPWFQKKDLWQQAKISSMEGAQEGMRSVVQELVEPLLRQQLSEGASEGVRRGVRQGVRQGVLAAAESGVQEGVSAGLRALREEDVTASEGEGVAPSADEVWKKAWSAVTCEDCEPDGAEADQNDTKEEEWRRTAAEPVEEARRGRRAAAPRRESSGRRKTAKPPLQCAAKQRSGAPCTRPADYFLRSRNGAAVNLVRQRSLVWPLSPMLAPGWWKAKRGYVPLCRQHRNRILQQLRLQHPVLYTQVFALGASA